MIQPTLQQLRYLVAVADALHFGRAAKQCGVTQSALSSGVQELERLLGVTLVERSRRRVALTPVGEDVVRRARRILVAVRDLVEAASEGAEPLTGALKLGVIPTIGPYLVPALVARLRPRYPRLRLFLREEQTHRLLEQLHAGTVDAALVALPYDLGEVEVQDVGGDPLRVVLPASHPLADRKALTEAELDEQPLLMLEDGHCLRDQALAACGLRPDVNEVFQATSLRTVVEMVASELGLTFIPEMAIEAEIGGRHDLVVIPLAEPGERRIALTWRRGSAREAEYRILGEEIAAAMEG